MAGSAWVAPAGSEFRRTRRFEVEGDFLFRDLEREGDFRLDRGLLDRDLDLERLLRRPLGCSCSTWTDGVGVVLHLLAPLRRGAPVPNQGFQKGTRSYLKLVKHPCSEIQGNLY